MDEKLGIFYWYGYVLPLAERLKQIKQAGFEAVSIWWEDEMVFLCEPKEQVPSLVRREGLYLDSIHLPYHITNDLWQDNREVKRRALETYSSWFYQVAHFQVPNLVMHLSHGKALPGPVSIGFDSFSSLLDLAEELGLFIGVENTQSITYLPDLFTRFHSPNLRLCYDSSHDQLVGEPGSVLYDFGKYISTTHLSDNDGEEDRHWVPGEGLVDWPGTISHLRKMDYRGILSLEVSPREREKGPEAFLEQAYQQARWLQEMYWSKEWVGADERERIS